jgi:hypothetical protein
MKVPLEIHATFILATTSFVTSRWQNYLNLVVLLATCNNFTKKVVAKNHISCNETYKKK